MTSKLKCPVCDVPLTECGDMLSCPNDHCGWVGNAALWQALIQAKQDLDFFIKEQVRTQTALIERTKELDKCQKDLEIATKALGYYADSRFGKKQDDGTYVLEIDKGCGVTVVYTYDPRPAKQAIKQIEQKE